jgi:hypothetical protein
MSSYGLIAQAIPAHRVPCSSIAISAGKMGNGRQKYIPMALHARSPFVALSLFQMLFFQTHRFQARSAMIVLND